VDDAGLARVPAREQRAHVGHVELQQCVTLDDRGVGAVCRSDRRPAHGPMLPHRGSVDFGRMSVIPLCFDRYMFDVVDHLDDLRSWPTDRLVARRREVVHAKRRLDVEELTIVRILDERGRIDPGLGEHGESARTLREKVETARALESLPEIAAAAYEGALSAEQLSAVTRFADEESDAEWARRAPNVAPGELARLARNASKPSTADSQARHEARSLRMWWTPDKGMLHLHGQFPDVMGAQVEATITKLTEQMKPAKGQAWDSFEHRAADALHELCDQPEEQDATPNLAARPVLQTLIPMSGPAEIAGVPIADSRLEQLRANASIEPVLVDDDGTPIAIGKRFSALSPKIVRAVLLRDLGCQICGRHRRLQIHHLRPRSWGGTDEISELASVCATCHPDLIPHGNYALVGNPNVPGGLRKVHVDDLTAEQREQVGLPPRRAGPTAA
jgi:hypothetical protein